MWANVSKMWVKAPSKWTEAKVKTNPILKLLLENIEMEQKRTCYQHSVE